MVRSSKELKVSMMRIMTIRGGGGGVSLLDFPHCKRRGGFIAELP